MASRIKPLRRTGSSGVPNVANMQDGEIAVNSFDKKIWMKVGSNLVEVANASSGDWNTLSNRPANLISWASINPNTKVGTTGNWDMAGSLSLRNDTLKVFRGGQATPGIEIGAGWGNQFDGIGWIINRWPEIPLRLAGRNQGVVLSIGEGATQTTLNGEFLTTGAAAALSTVDRSTGQIHSMYGTGNMLNFWRPDGGNIVGMGGDGLHSYAGWVRTYGNTGWYSQTHGGGWFMEDATWIRSYNSKRVLIASHGGSEGDLCLSSTSPTIRFHDTDSGTNHWLHCNDNQIGFLANNSYSWSAYRTPENNWACMGNIIAYASDRSLKTNIVDVSHAKVEDFFDRFRVREFDWDKDAIEENRPTFSPTAEHEVGAIAQEVEEFYPGMVAEHEDGIKTILWEKAVPMLIAEVQALRKETQSLRKRVEELENT